MYIESKILMEKYSGILCVVCCVVRHCIDNYAFHSHFLSKGGLKEKREREKKERCHFDGSHYTLFYREPTCRTPKYLKSLY